MSSWSIAWRRLLRISKKTKWATWFDELMNPMNNCSKCWPIFTKPTASWSRITYLKRTTFITTGNRSCLPKTQCNSLNSVSSRVSRKWTKPWVYWSVECRRSCRSTRPRSRKCSRRRNTTCRTSTTKSPSSVSNCARPSCAWNSFWW